MGRSWWVLAGFLGATGCGWFDAEEPEPVKATKPAPKAGKGHKGKKKSTITATPEGERGARDAGPNVLILVWDTARADRTSAYGYPLDTTPNLTKLAGEGMLFERAVSPAMWTLPSHASLFTGLPESAHGAWATHKWLDARFPTLADTFWLAGYDTYLFSANPYLDDHTNLGQGFETREFPWDAKWKAAAAAATTSKIHPDDASNTLGPKWQEREYPAGRSNDNVKDAGPVAVDALTRWVDGRAEPKRPWLAVVNYMEAHMPRLPSLASREALFGPEEVADQLRLDQSYGYMLAATVGKHTFDDATNRAISTVYDASMRDLDAATGMLFERLRARGELDNTIVVVTSDHGEHLGEHGRYDHKYSVYAPLVRVPLVIRYPAKVSPARVTEVVSTLGVFATVAELAGVPLPGGTLSHSLLRPGSYGGEAFSELVAATPMALDRVAKLHPSLDREPWMRTYDAVETLDSKCIESSIGVRELYDMPADALEQVDRASSDPTRTGAVCGRIAAWHASFSPYDPKLGKGEGPGKIGTEERERLEVLGYVE